MTEVKLISYSKSAEGMNLGNCQELVAYCARVSNPANQMNPTSGFMSSVVLSLPRSLFLSLPLPSSVSRPLCRYIWFSIARAPPSRSLPLSTLLRSYCLVLSLSTSLFLSDCLYLSLVSDCRLFTRA